MVMKILNLHIVPIILISVQISYGQNSKPGIGLEVRHPASVTYMISLLGNEKIITEKIVTDKVESFFGGAGIYPELVNGIEERVEFQGCLYIAIRMSGGGFNIDLHFLRWLTYETVPGKKYSVAASTWNESSTGGNDPGLIDLMVLENLSEHIENFISDYIKANPRK